MSKQFSHFCQAHQCAKHTDRKTMEHVMCVLIGRVCEMYVIWPSDRCSLIIMTHLACVNTGVWLQHSSSSIFCLSSSTGALACSRLQEVSAPATLDDIVTEGSLVFSSFSATADTLCCLMADGRLFARTGVGPHCPTGVDWATINLPDLGQFAWFCSLSNICLSLSYYSGLRWAAGSPKEYGSRY